MAMEIAFRYTAVAALVSAIYWYYGGFDTIISKYFPKKPQASRSEPGEKASKKKKPRNKLIELAQSGTDSASTNEKKRKISSPPAGTAPTYPSGSNNNVVVSREDDGDMNAKEFAKQFAKTQQGISFASSGKQNGKSKIRTVKASTVDLESPNMSAENSSTGQDGDDETTPAGSPAFNAVTSAAAPDASGISDMLEPPKEGPKSIRLTGWEEAKPRKQKPSPKAPEPVETKKQRQRKQKREEEKARIAESNKEHDAKREQQMRGARMVEGTSNQTKANAFKPRASVWTAPKSQNDENAVKQPPANVATIAPLDTFEPQALTDITNNSAAVMTRPVSEIQNDESSSAAANEPKKEPSTQKTITLAASDPQRATPPHNSLERMQSSQSWADEVNEEDENSWSQVTTKKEKKKGKKPDEIAHGGLTASSKLVNGQAQKTVPITSTNGTPARPQAINRYKSLETEATSTGLQDDEWEA